MDTWLKLSLILSSFGFLKEIRPSEPFIYDFLVGPWRNITETQVVTQVYPVATYSYLILLVVIFLITDLLRYKPLIIILGLSGISLSGMLLWTTSLFALQVLEVIYSLFMAAEVAYFTYIYAKVEKEHYTIVTSHTRSSVLAGRCVSGVLAQFLISFNMMNYKELNYITFGAMIMATCWSLLLPSVAKSIYFNREGEEEIDKFTRFHNGISLMKSQIMLSFRSENVIMWSIWYSFSTCGFLQVQSYMQPLWRVIIDSDKKMYNGAVEAVLTLLGFCGAMVAGILKMNWGVMGNFARIFISIVQGSIIMIGAQTTNIYVCYICYIIYGMLYHFLITVASSEIAKKLKEDTFGLIFGFNTFVAMILQSLLTLFVVNDVFNFYLDIRHQYLVYGGVCFFIALFDICSFICNYFRKRK